MLSLWLVLSASMGLAYGQINASYPHDYPGKPSGDYSPEWQTYFQVTDPLPNVTFPISRNWAGNIPVNRADHPDNTLFFWAWEKQSGSLTAAAGENQDQPWGIWLNGGPGSSSMLGMFYENGPLHLGNDNSMFANNQSWDRVADFIWLDQPVGVGFATADATGYIADEDQLGLDFIGFLENLVKVFPSLRTRPLFLTGESYAGVYIPYIMKAYFSMENPPVNLKKIAIGNPTIGSPIVSTLMPVLQVIQTYPQLIGYDAEVYNYFKEQDSLCGYDLQLTYPQSGTFPTLRPPLPSYDAALEPQMQEKRELFHRALQEDLRDGGALRKREVDEERLAKRDQWKRDLTGRANGTIDPYYQCDLFQEMVDYALNYSLPWRGNSANGFDVYFIPDALDPKITHSPWRFLNNRVTRAAIHAPMSKNWSRADSPFLGVNGTTDPSPAPMTFLSDLATQASNKGIGVVLYSGNDDARVSHFSTEVVIQNTTFGGAQGFSRRPSTPWYDDEGQFAGIVHQERNWTYVLVAGAGHLVPQDNPARALVLLREFVIGSNTTGLVTDTSSGTSVVGGEVSSLGVPVLRGQAEIYRGSSATQSTTVFPSPTIEAWNNFLATATTTPNGGGDTRVQIARGTWIVGLIVMLFVMLD